jgi:voltage-gated potassium channel
MSYRTSLPGGGPREALVREEAQADKESRTMINAARPGKPIKEVFPRVRAFFRGSRELYRDLKRENLFRIIVGIAMLVLVSALLVFLSEMRGNRQMFKGYFDAIWWAVVTWATVGYGDKYPVSPAGKVLAMVLVFASVAFSSILSGTIASIFVDRKIREGKGLQVVTVKNHIVVCGWNPNTERLFAGLRLFGREKTQVVLVNEMDPEAFQSLAAKWKSLYLRFVRGDFTREEVIRRAAVQHARAVVIVSDCSGANTLENADERTILATLAVKHTNPLAVTSAEIGNPENEAHLRRADVDDIGVNGEFNGFLLASATVSSGIPLVAKEIFSSDGKNVVKMSEIPPVFIGKPFSELSGHYMRSGEGVLIGLLSEEKKMTLDDILAGDTSAIDDFIKRKFEEADVDYFAEERKSENVKLNPGPDYTIKNTDKAFLIGQPG